MIRLGAACGAETGVLGGRHHVPAISCENGPGPVLSWTGPDRTSDGSPEMLDDTDGRVYGATCRMSIGGKGAWSNAPVHVPAIKLGRHVSAVRMSCDSAASETTCYRRAAESRSPPRTVFFLLPPN